MENDQPIGIFDSGVGGLTYAKELKRLMPKEKFIYFGDTKHLPYGDKTPSVIIDYVRSIVHFLLSKNCKAIFIACNTATAVALKEVQALVKNKTLLFDVISPVVDKIAFHLNQQVGVIGTTITIKSHIYKNNIKKLNKSIRVNELATPLLVPIIEEGYYHHPIAEIALKTYLSNNKLKDIDALILGCTHYPILLQQIKNYYQNKIQIYDSPLIVANHVKYTLENLNLCNLSKQNEMKDIFYVSALTNNFNTLSKRFFGKQIELIELDIHNLKQ